MKRNITVALVAFACGTLFGALNYSIIVGDNGIGFMPKSAMTLSGSFYDTRDWGPMDWLQHPDVAAWKAKKKFQKIASAAKELKEDIKEGAKKAYEDVKEGAKNAKEVIKEGADNVGQAAKEQYQEVKENVKDAVSDDEEEGNDPPVTATDQPVE